MNKLVILKDDEIIDEIELKSDSLFAGREPEAAVYLDDPSVSRRHARFFTVFGETFVEDLNSTNGTLLNHRKVVKHILKHDDVIVIGSFTIRFIDEEAAKVQEQNQDETVVISSSDRSESDGAAKKVIVPKTAKLRFFRGPKKGDETKIDRSLYTIGRPGGEVAAIARRPQGFFLLHIGGEQYPKINNEEIDTVAGVQLNEGDVVEVGENLAEISFG
ncbi:MAG: FHA domain-containing protein [Gammaproteobacteria bacterium]|nr:FHA domain-containing protein [Gammaproteobacteria bacterium]